MENKELSPQEYFDYLKGKKETVTDKKLTEFYNGCLTLVEKYKVTGQKKVIQKLKFLVDCVDRERAIVKLGINTFVYREDIEEYIDNISKNTVKIIELENYPREIPDKIVETIAKTKDIFDQMYVVFTDYTGNVEKEVEKTRRDKDPILFGTFQKRLDNSNDRFVGEILVNDRFYYLGDWVDEYCDLTMDKFLEESGKEKLKTINTPINASEITAELNRLDEQFKVVSVKPKQAFFNKVKSALNIK